MKDYQIIVEFRKAYRKLNYVKNQLTVGDLCAFVREWCNEYSIPKNMFSLFEELAFTYVDQDFDTLAICKWCKMQRRKSNFKRNSKNFSKA